MTWCRWTIGIQIKWNVISYKITNSRDPHCHCKLVASPRVVVEGPKERAQGGAGSSKLHELYWERVPSALQNRRSKNKDTKGGSYQQSRTLITQRVSDWICFGLSLLWVHQSARTACIPETTSWCSRWSPQALFATVHLYLDSTGSSPQGPQLPRDSSPQVLLLIRQREGTMQYYFSFALPNSELALTLPCFAEYHSGRVNPFLVYPNIWLSRFLSLFC